MPGPAPTPCSDFVPGGLVVNTGQAVCMRCGRAELVHYSKRELLELLAVAPDDQLRRAVEAFVDTIDSPLSPRWSYASHVRALVVTASDTTGAFYCRQCGDKFDHVLDRLNHIESEHDEL